MTAFHISDDGLRLMTGRTSSGSSKPHQTEAVYLGVKPQNQRSRLLEVVPVLPAQGTPGTWAGVPVPYWQA